MLHNNLLTIRLAIVSATGLLAVAIQLVTSLVVRPLASGLLLAPCVALQKQSRPKAEVIR
jgi:hypothetical protein